VALQDVLERENRFLRSLIERYFRFYDVRNDRGCGAGVSTTAGWGDER